jgi:hypothetical protein
VAEWDLDVGSTGARLQWIRPLGPPDENGAAGGRYTAESLEVYQDYRPDEVDFLLPALIADLSRLGVRLQDATPWPPLKGVVRLAAE